MKNAQVRKEQAQILTFWWMLELFNPQTVPAVTTNNLGRSRYPRRVVNRDQSLRLPWQSLGDPNPPGTKDKKKVWRHTVYLGVYDLKETQRTLYNAFAGQLADESDVKEMSSTGTSACAGLLIDGDGSLIADSVVLSSALWATSRMSEVKPHNSLAPKAFKEAQTNLRNKIASLIDSSSNTSGDNSKLFVSHEVLDVLLRLAHEAAGVAAKENLCSHKIVIDSKVVSMEKSDAGADHDFLNSFFLDDLNHVCRHVEEGTIGTGLATYLTPNTKLIEEQRVDVIKHPAIIKEKTRLDQLPEGRWPTHLKHSLALSQQFAVNRALNDLDSQNRVMGVNGPPGTGKTTMLRDIIAGNIVKRAQRLAELDNPHAAFTDTQHRWSEGGYRYTLPVLQHNLTGFEMVVASANNSAVENITTEIPTQTAIDDPWRDTADYFKDISTRILRSSGGVTTTPSENVTPPTAWGLVAARLGNKANRSSFRSEFWFNKSDATGAKPTHTTSANTSSLGMMERLKRWRNNEDTITPWHEAREKFAVAENRVKQLVAERIEAYNRLNELRQLNTMVAKLTADQTAALHRCEQLEDAIMHNCDSVQQASDMYASLAPQETTSPPPQLTLVQTICALKKGYINWRRNVHETKLKIDETKNLLRQLDQADAELKTISDKLDELCKQQKIQKNHCEQDKNKYYGVYPNADLNDEAREKFTPWLDEELNHARSDLFLAAMKLHEDFIANTAEEMSKGLRAAIDIVGGTSTAKLSEKEHRAAWQLFFLVVPVVSTTFASFGRMFSQLSCEDIGWLFIDEAGQASPQHAVGAVWRSRCTIAVGDPLQLEPIVTLPEKAKQIIADKYDIDDIWVPPRASVQTLADRVTPEGTSLHQNNTQMWISAPLRVHRRCDDPMFSLCNKIAYNGLMINDVHRVLDNPEQPDPFDSSTTSAVYQSCWVDVAAATKGTHCQYNQIKRLKSLLGHLKDKEVPLSDVIVISPFRAVADELRALNNDDQYSQLRAGTIHTAQGREAAVVILVLGGDPCKPGAAAYWARTPNLVNVAVSRAKRRLYVIADCRYWGRHSYFNELVNCLKIIK